jgi:undecaprenyl phosphate-alpha-L-ara4N flippase subunit ArnE
MKVALGFIVMISCTVSANLLMKSGAVSGPGGGVIFGLHWRTIVGLAVFGFAGVVYAWLLRFLPLNVAQSFAAAQFVAVILASALILAEPIAASRWIGIGLIAAGILTVGLTLDRGAGTPADKARTQDAKAALIGSTPPRQAH